jgi:hypothetical protein
LAINRRKTCKNVQKKGKNGPQTPVPEPKLAANFRYFFFFPTKKVSFSVNKKKRKKRIKNTKIAKKKAKNLSKSSKNHKNHKKNNTH